MSTGDYKFRSNVHNFEETRQALQKLSRSLEDIANRLGTTGGTNPSADLLVAIAGGSPDTSSGVGHKLSLDTGPFTVNIATASDPNSPAVIDIKDLGISSDHLAANSVTTTKIINNAVTYAKIQNVAANSLVGNVTGSSAVATDITLAAGTGITIADDDVSQITITNASPAGAGSDTTAIHDNVASEISAITAKTTPVAGDFFVIEDSAASNAKKSLTFLSLYSTINASINRYANIQDGLGGSTTAAAGADSLIISGGYGIDAAVTTDTVTFTLDLSELTAETIVAADSIPFEDATDSGTHKVTVANLNAVLDHAALQNIGSNSHATIDTHLANTSNPHSTTVANLTDTTITGPADLDLLQYDLASAKWVDRSLAEAGISATGHTHVEAHITDLQAYVLSGTQLGTAVVDVFKQKSGSALEFRGLKAGSADIVLSENASDITIDFDPTQTTISELGNVSASSPTAHDYLVYNGTDNWIAQVNKFDATTAPTANEDSGDGYAVGSRWIDVTNDKEYVCLDSTLTAAVWTETTQGGGSTQNLWETIASDTGSTAADSATDTLTIAGSTGCATVVSGDTLSIIVGFSDDESLTFGASGDIKIRWDTANTGDSAQIGVGIDGGTGDQTGWLSLIDEAHIGNAARDAPVLNRTNPTFAVWSGDIAGTADYVEIYHDQTDGQINSAAGNLNLSAAGNVTIGGNYVYRATGTDVPVTDGGTGASTAGDARTNLGLVIGTDVAAQTHASQHQSGGSDAIKLDDLSAPDDNTDLDATTSAHGLLPKLGGGSTNFLRADGTWNAPSVGSASTVEITVYSSAGSSAGQPVMISDYNTGNSVPTILSASSANENLPPIGLVKSTIAAASTGTVTIHGEVTGLNTSGFSGNGVPLYLSGTNLVEEPPKSLADSVWCIGQVTYANASGGVFVNPVKIPVKTATIYIEDPTASDSYPICYIDHAAIVLAVTSFTDVTSSTVTFNIEERSTWDTAGTDLMSADLVADDNEQSTTTFSNDELAADTWLHYAASAVAGSPTKVWVAVRYMELFQTPA